MVQQQPLALQDVPAASPPGANGSAGARLVVGYWLPDKSTILTDFPTLTSLCQKHHIALKKLSLSVDLEKQLPFHLLLHKISVLYKHSRRQKGDEAVHQFSKLFQFIKAHPELHVIDLVEPQLQLFDRWHVCQLIEEAIDEVEGVSIPPWASVSCPEDLDQAVHSGSLSFPLICKPRNTWESFSHEMCLIFNSNQLSHVMLPTIAQKFVKHNAVLFKVYVIGDDVTVQRRPSVDFPESVLSRQEVMTFNGHKISKSSSQADYRNANVDMGLVRRVAASLRSRTRLNIFGLDILVDDRNKYYVVDVNPFPGCSSLDSFHQSMLKLLLPYVPKKSYSDSSPADISPCSQLKDLSS